MKAGTVRALASASAERLGSMPDVPTLAELGFANVSAELWWGVLSPAHTPMQTTGQLAAWFETAMRAPKIETKLHDLGLYPAVSCGAKIGSFPRKEFEEDLRIIQGASLKN